MAICEQKDCNQKTASDEIEYCTDCLRKILKLLPLFQKPYNRIKYKYKSLDEIRRNPRVCKIRGCKQKTLIRGLCTECYITYVKALEKKTI